MTSSPAEALISTAGQAPPAATNISGASSIPDRKATRQPNCSSRAEASAKNPADPGDTAFIIKSHATAPPMRAPPIRDERR